MPTKPSSAPLRAPRSHDLERRRARRCARCAISTGRAASTCSRSPTTRRGTGAGCGADNYAAYLAEIEAEAERARRLYDLLVIPGLELTYDDPDPLEAAHAVAVGPAVVRRRRRPGSRPRSPPRGRRGGARRRPPVCAGAARRRRRAAPAPSARGRSSRALVDRFELFNRHTLFGWVAAAGLPVIATGDFHRIEHLATWKTLLPPCAEGAKARLGLVQYLRSCAARVSRSRLDDARRSGWPPDRGGPARRLRCGRSALALRGVRGVAELAELAGDEIDDLLADVHGVVADPLDTTRDDEHPQRRTRAPAASRRARARPRWRCGSRGR